MSWEDEDFDVPVNQTGALDFADEQEGFVDDWETAANSDDEARIGAARSAKPKLSSAQRIEERKRKEQEDRERKALEKTSEASKAEKQKLELESDFVNASDLLAAADVHPRARTNAKSSTTSKADSGPSKLSDLAIFKATNAKDYADLRKTLVPVLNGLADKNSAVMHTNFVVETCRDLCKPLTSDQVDKVMSTLEAISRAKYRDERAKRLGARQKPNIKVGAAKQEEKVQIQAPEELADDGLDDDDFM